MLDRPQIVQTSAQLAAVIRLTVPREEIQAVMGPGSAELVAALPERCAPRRPHDRIALRHVR